MIYYFISATSANITEEAKKIYKSRNFRLKVEPSKGKYRKQKMNTLNKMASFLKKLNTCIELSIIISNSLKID